LFSFSFVIITLAGRRKKRRRNSFIFSFLDRETGLLLLSDILIHENHMLAASRRHWQAAMCGGGERSIIHRAWM
jgi:hypothetical protein